jgi:hypothetical protein
MDPRFAQFVCLTIVGLASVAAAQTSAERSAASVAGSCNVVVVASPDARVRVEGCGRNPRDAAAFRVLEQHLNQIITAERVQGDRLQELVAGVNQ